MNPKRSSRNGVDNPISKDKEEEMSSALIAQMLAEDAISHEDNNYYAEYSNNSKGYDSYQHYKDQGYNFDDNESSEDEFDPALEQKQLKKEAASRKRKSEIAVKKDDKLQSGLESTISVPNKKPKANSDQFNSGVYTDSEEKLFLEGLELHGRQWPKLQKHVATRDSNSIRSHAQKHFIKMYRDGKPLPDKVKESGEGYTLSGKPLDITSAAAKPYFTHTIPKNTINININIAENANTDTSPHEDAEKLTEELEIVNVEKIAEKACSISSPSESSITTDLKTLYDDKGRTNYSTSRLRTQRLKHSINYGQISKDEDPLTMVKCEPFIGKPGSDTTGSQPFELSVNSNVLLTMDFHAHLMTTEIIGFLAGEWDKETKCIKVRAAFPCRSLETGQNDVNVEMDPTSAIETRQLIEDHNMKVVGWYHSHPTFVPDPSLVDIENQHNYQLLCRDNHDHTSNSVALEPFVGAIVGPYDPALPASASVINWFHVCNTNTDRPVPKRLIYALQEDENITSDEANRLFQLLDTYRMSSERVNFSTYWRQNLAENKLQKMIKSLGSRMPWVQRKLKEEAIVDDEFLDKLQSSLKDWNL